MTVLIKASLCSPHNHTLTRLCVCRQSVCVLRRFALQKAQQHLTGCTPTSSRRTHSPVMAGSCEWLARVQSSLVRPTQNNVYSMCVEQHSSCFRTLSTWCSVEAAVISAESFWCSRDSIMLWSQALRSTLTRSVPLMSQPLKAVLNAQMSSTHGRLENKQYYICTVLSLVRYLIRWIPVI